MGSDKITLSSLNKVVKRVSSSLRFNIVGPKWKPDFIGARFEARKANHSRNPQRWNQNIDKRS